METNHIVQLLSSQLGVKAQDFLLRFAAVADAEGVSCYLVGGVIRDLLLAKCPAELDFVVEQDAVEFVNHLHRNWRTLFPDFPEITKPVTFKRYKTAKFNFRTSIQNIHSGCELQRVDLATAREEKYPVAGGVPEISWSKIAQDLLRRDFSINSIAVPVTTVSSSSILDPCGGVGDLELKVLRVLHPRSFIDDPARLIRAVRFSARLGFNLEPQTKELFEQAISSCCLSSLSSQRRFEEFRKGLSEDCVKDVLRLMQDFGMLEQILPFEVSLEQIKNIPNGFCQWEQVFAFVTKLVAEVEVHEFLESVKRSSAEISAVFASRRNLSV